MFFIVFPSKYNPVQAAFLATGDLLLRTRLGHKQRVPRPYSVECYALATTHQMSVTFFELGALLYLYM